MTIYFSTPVSIALTLLAAAMWGSWMQVIKHRKDYPILGLTFLLYLFSFILVWIITLLLAPGLLPEGLAVTVARSRDVMWEIMLGGAMMSAGMILSLDIMERLGLTLTTTLSGAITSILGILTSVWKEGLPDTPLALPVIIATAILFLLAGYICSKASQMCAQDRETEKRVGERQKNPVTLSVILLILLNSILMNGWASGTATGTAAGLPPVLTCAYMATGSMLSVAVIGGVLFTRKRQWGVVFCIGADKTPLLLGAVAACCHYGGNVLSIYAMPAISATMSFLFGKTANLWTYFWGFYYREFQGAGRKTILTLTAGLLLYFAGLGLLFFYNYG